VFWIFGFQGNVISNFRNWRGIQASLLDPPRFWLVLHFLALVYFLLVLHFLAVGFWLVLHLLALVFWLVLHFLALGSWLVLHFLLPRFWLVVHFLPFGVWLVLHFRSTSLICVMQACLFADVADAVQARGNHNEVYLAYLPRKGIAAVPPLVVARSSFSCVQEIDFLRVRQHACRPLILKSRNTCRPLMPNLGHKAARLPAVYIFLIFKDLFRTH